MSEPNNINNSGKIPAQYLQDALNASLVIHSSDIFNGGNLVMIRHGQDWYRLMITKQGKLILTK